MEKNKEGVTWLQTDTQEGGLSVVRLSSTQEKPEIWTWKLSIFNCLKKKKKSLRLIKHIEGLDLAFRPPGYDFSLQKSKISPLLDTHCWVGLPDKSNRVWWQEKNFDKRINIHL